MTQKIYLLSGKPSKEIYATNCSGKRSINTLAQSRQLDRVGGKIGQWVTDFSSVLFHKLAAIMITSGLRSKKTVAYAQYPKYDDNILHSMTKTA